MKFQEIPRGLGVGSDASRRTGSEVDFRIARDSDLPVGSTMGEATGQWGILRNVLKMEIKNLKTFIAGRKKGEQGFSGLGGD